jgi:hypothetical protein
MRQQRPRDCEVLRAKRVAGNICSRDGSGLHRGSIRQIPPRSPTCIKMNSSKCSAGLGCKEQVIIPLYKYCIDVSTCLCALAELESRLRRLSSRHCCRSKPTGEQRQATRGAGRLPGRLAGPGPSVNGPAIRHMPWLGVARRAT